MENTAIFIIINSVALISFISSYLVAITGLKNRNYGKSLAGASSETRKNIQSMKISRVRKGLIMMLITFLATVAINLIMGLCFP